MAVDKARERENRRWWLLWRRRHRTLPTAHSQTARILATVAREGQVGERPAAFYLTDRADGVQP